MKSVFITHRSPADLKQLQDLRQKVVHRTATADEWTQWLQPMYAAFGIDDLVRIGSIIEELSADLVAAGYNTGEDAPVFTTNELPVQSKVEALLAKIMRIRNSIHLPATVPMVPEQISTCKDANDLETVLQTVRNQFDALLRNRTYAGEFYSGEYGLL